jgi:16S rRNA (adenine1518-N6/adenine1519-N6)-dimethyltransferase
MFQLEVAKRLVAPSGSREYGILSVLLQAFYRCQIVLKLAPAHFEPPPAVHSAVIQCVRKQNFMLPCSEDLFRSVVRTAFGQRRKVLRNSLGRSTPALHDFQEAQPFLNRRAEELSWEEFAFLTSLLEQTK